MKSTKEKKQISPNECSTLRWLAVLGVTLGVGTLLAAPFGGMLENTTDNFLGVSYLTLAGMLTFIPYFVVFAIALKLIGKTSLKDFTLGAGGTFNKKACLISLGLYAAGFAIPYLIKIGNIRANNVKTEQFIFLFVFMLLTVWIQTTYEEFMFRGLFLRWACKNKIGYTKKTLLIAVVSGLVFALFHTANPEVTTQKGIDVVLATFSYMIIGFVYCLADLHFGSLLPGIVMHWFNNFILVTLLTAEVTAAPAPALFIDTTPHSASWSVISNVLLCLPLLVFIVVDTIKRKKNAPVCEE